MVVDPHMLEACVRDELNVTAPRYAPTLLQNHQKLKCEQFAREYAVQNPKNVNSKTLRFKSSTTNNERSDFTCRFSYSVITSSLSCWHLKRC